MTHKCVPLSELTTLRIGGPAEVFSVPSSREQLFEEVTNCLSVGTPVRIIGKGSNILVADAGVKGHVISLAECANHISLIGPNVVRVGAGVPLFKFIRFSVDNDLFGNEYLSSVPGTIGGAIFMNAGTWTDLNMFVSDYLETVELFDGSSILELRRDECAFGYRRSVFQDKPSWIILSATFRLPSQDRVEGERKRKARLDYARAHQDLRYGSAGSIFRSGYSRVFQLLPGIRLGRAGWSRKTRNWINNYGDASSTSVKALILVAKTLHRLAGKKCELEIRLWDR